MSRYSRRARTTEVEAVAFTLRQRVSLQLIWHSGAKQNWTETVSASPTSVTLDEFKVPVKGAAYTKRLFRFSTVP
jgi:hypothetical protein